MAGAQQPVGGMPLKLGILCACHVYLICTSTYMQILYSTATVNTLNSTYGSHLSTYFPLTALKPCPPVTVLPFILGDFLASQPDPDIYATCSDNTLHLYYWISININALKPDLPNMRLSGHCLSPDKWMYWRTHSHCNSFISQTIKINELILFAAINF